MSGRPTSAGFTLALVAAAAFGAATPVIQRLGHGVGMFSTAALLYTGAALFALPTRRGATIEAPVRARHLPRLAMVALFGAVLAPAALAWGLQHASGTSAGLMLNVEAPLTVVLGALLNYEHVGKRVWGALALMCVGAALLLTGHAGDSRASLFGLVAILLATAGWALDNALTSPLASLDTSSVVLAKAALGASASAVLALVFREPCPTLVAVGGLVACGATGYGISLRLYILAQRRIGAARTASIFSVAPFVAALVAALLGQPVGVAVLLAAAPMFLGLWLHATERHAHRHQHVEVDHEHAHSHDDGHHTHHHAEPPVVGSHSHPHHHDRLDHEHEHGADAHHAHTHDA
jgi:drug/metabolite transporter (DMT)-like permease